jgi:hypothetical protein
MRKILALAGAVLTIGGGPAMAQSPSFAVTGSAPEICVLGQPALFVGSVVNVRNLSGANFQIEQLVDQTTLSTRSASAKVTFEAICTFPHRVVLQSAANGLWRNQTPGVARPGGFADAVPYSAVLNWGSASGALSADATSRGMKQQITPIADATVGTLTIDFAIIAGATNLAGNAPLLAGVYSDTLTVTLEPQ